MRGASHKTRPPSPRPPDCTLIVNDGDRLDLDHRVGIGEPVISTVVLVGVAGPK